MTHASVVDVLAGKYPVGTTQTVKGWIRTRRDSKAGISFLAVSDGSCFHPVQAVVPNTLANYENEVLRLTTACSVEVTGVVAASQGSGQAFETASHRGEGDRLGRRSGHLPDGRQAPQHRVPA